MNRLLFLCCIGSLAAMATALRAEEPRNAAPETSMVSKAADQSTLLPGAGGNGGRRGLIPGQQHDDAVCGDPAAGSCGAVAAEENKPAELAEKPAEQETPTRHDD